MGNVFVLRLILANGCRELDSLHQVIPEWRQNTRSADIPRLRGQDSGCGHVHSGGSGLWKGKSTCSLVLEFWNLIEKKLFIFPVCLTFSFFLNFKFILPSFFIQSVWILFDFSLVLHVFDIISSTFIYFLSIDRANFGSEQNYVSKCRKLWLHKALLDYCRKTN